MCYVSILLLLGLVNEIFYCEKDSQMLNYIDYGKWLEEFPVLLID